MIMHVMFVMHFAEKRIGLFLLCIGQSVVKRFERRDEFCHAIRMSLRDTLVGLDVINGGHVLGVGMPLFH